jgi:hypothetical protein
VRSQFGVLRLAALLLLRSFEGFLLQGGTETALGKLSPKDRCVSVPQFAGSFIWDSDIPVPNMLLPAKCNARASPKRLATQQKNILFSDRPDTSLNDVHIQNN